MTMTDANGRPYTYSRGQKDRPFLTLLGQALWGTPTSRDWKDGDPSPAVPTARLLGRQAPRSGIGGPRSLNDGRNSPQQWATPAVADGVGGHHPSEKSRLRGGNSTLNRDLARTGYPLRLNPFFVEWLMGLPLGWSDFALLAIPSSPRRPRGR